jgi:hypothetical protein
MEKLLKELINEVRKGFSDIEKKQKEQINYMAFECQTLKQILNKLIKLEVLNGNDKQCDSGNNQERE